MHQALLSLVRCMAEPPQANRCGAIATCTSVLELSALERTLLWSIRTWAAYHDAPQAIWRTLERAFTEEGIHPALEPFGQLMCALFDGLKRSPDIRCVRCLRMGKDENALLATFAAALEEPRHAIEHRLSALMLPTAACTGASAAAAMMHAIANSGLCMQKTNIDMRTATWPPSYQSMNVMTH